MFFFEIDNEIGLMKSIIKSCIWIVIFEQCVKVLIKLPMLLQLLYRLVLLLFQQVIDLFGYSKVLLLDDNVCRDFA